MQQAHAATAEVVEGRALAKGHAGQHNRGRTQRRAALSRALDRVRQAAKDSAMRLTALWHQVPSSDRLREAYYSLHHEAAPGVDGQTGAAYGAQLEPTLRDLSDRLTRGAYHAPPVERVYIPRADGRQRPIGQPTLADNIVQRATVEGLNAGYAQELLGFSSGARPGRRPHHAVDAGTVGIAKRHLNWGLDADMRARFHRVPLALHPDKTRLMECGRWASERRQRRGQGKPETCDLLGLTHLCSKTRTGKWTVRRKPVAKRFRKKVQEIRQILRARMHWPSRQRGAWRKSVLTGHDR
jgi:hypothetical protein